MGKVVTSSPGGAQQTTNVPDHKPEQKTKSVSPPQEKVEPKAEQKVEKAPEPVEASDPEAPILSEDSRKYVNKQHRLRKEAEEAAAEAERFAETQYNERRLADSRAEAAERKAKELEEKLTPAPKPVELKKPEKTDEKYKLPDGTFNWEQFSEDQATFVSTKAIEDLKKAQAEEKTAAENAKAVERLKAQADKARTTYPDFDKVMESVKGTEADQAPQFVLNAIYESDLAADLAYYLAKNPEEAQRIYKLKPIRGIAELGKLEDKLAKPVEPVKKAPVQPVIPERGGAPAPITPLTGEGTVGINTDPSKMSYKELRAYERARAREKASR